VQGAYGGMGNSMNWVSVTEALSVLKRFEGVPTRTLMQAMAEGTEIHKCCLSYAKGLYLPPPADLVRAVEGFKHWFEITVEKVLCVEERMYDKNLCLTGRVDLIAKLKGERLYSVIDLKRTTADWICGLQLSAYEHLAFKKYERRFGTRLALLVGRDGSIKAVPFTDKADFAVFLGVLSAYNHSRKAA